MTEETKPILTPAEVANLKDILFAAQMARNIGTVHLEKCEKTINKLVSIFGIEENIAGGGGGNKSPRAEA